MSGMTGLQLSSYIFERREARKYYLAHIIPVRCVMPIFRDGMAYDDHVWHAVTVWHTMTMCGMQ